MSNAKEKLFAKLDKPTLTPHTFMGENLFLRHWSERDKSEWAAFFSDLAKAKKTDSYIRCRAVAKTLRGAFDFLAGRTRAGCTVSLFRGCSLLRSDCGVNQGAGNRSKKKLADPTVHFLFRLAGHLGYTVSDLLDHLGEGELAGWQEFWHLEHFGCEWWRHAQLCSVVANFNSWGIKKPLEPEDFLPRSRPKPLPDAISLHNAFCAVFAGRITQAAA